MEGVVVVEALSGTLHYTRSFSAAFDARHPKAERLNLGALIFALQNFADSSVQSPDVDDAFDAVGDSSPSCTDTGIAMFATPKERMVLARTPSKKLLIVLFTAPTVGAAAAKWLVRRVAYNYENGNATELRLMVTLNQVPRLFRDAFSRAVEDQVEHELVALVETLFLSAPSTSDPPLIPEQGEEFVFFHYSERLGESQRSECSEGEERNSGSHESLNAPNVGEVKGSQEPRAPNPPMMLAQMPRGGGGLTRSFRNMMASTRSLLPLPSHAKAVVKESHSAGKSKKKRRAKRLKKARWRAKNAVMDHTEPNVLQRILAVDQNVGRATDMEPHRTGPAYAVARVLIPFVEFAAAPVIASEANASVPKNQRQLEYLTWKNIPATQPEEPKQGATGSSCSVVGWRRGSCLLFYPATLTPSGRRHERRVRSAIAAFFDLVEPLLRARTALQT